MSTLVLAVVLAPVLLALTGLAALVIHGRIAEQAMRRGRSEDLPQMLESSGRTLVGLTGAARLRRRAGVPAGQYAVSSGSSPLEDTAGREGTAQ
ncbi:hypothetical protein OG453_44260 [Streptomyces sp. NBC_01381]|uniref:hypothetical protein n=1 Tax=Streptomyces sp. NBC_01381 TaxID=2903845 RepID=UPI002258C4F5|nr:hypothetical protein [Streptomyces sp. NBC_01381]MCX4673573.1 hypothetical protein [Streptomyces sp. NBC_01381]